MFDLARGDCSPKLGHRFELAEGPRDVGAASAAPQAVAGRKGGRGERAKEMVLKKHNWARKYGPPVQARWFLLSAHRHSTLVGGGAFWSRSVCMEVDAGHPQVQPAMRHDPCRNRRLCSVIFAGLLREYQRQVKPFTSACQWPHSRGTKHSRQEEIQAALRESRLKVPLVAGEHG